MDIRLPDDGMGHEPTVRADFAEVRVSILGAATQVYVLPALEEMRRVYRRMPDDVAFWKAITAAPDDELPRVVYADWLDERGDPAGAILHGSEPVALEYWAAVNDRWEQRNRRKADWRLAMNEMLAFVLSGGGQILPGPEFTYINLQGFIRRVPGSNEGEWRALSLSMPSGGLAPPFVYYLLLLAAFGLLQKQAQPAMRFSQPGAGNPSQGAF
jgi:uncharacterized protein (TIGR02996 family)